MVRPLLPRLQPSPCLTAVVAPAQPLPGCLVLRAILSQYYPIELPWSAVGDGGDPKVRERNFHLAFRVAAAHGVTQAKRLERRSEWPAAPGRRL